MLTRRAVQFHWFNPDYSSFDDYLASLAQPKRKKIRAEKRKVLTEGFCSSEKSAVTLATPIGICSCAVTPRRTQRTYSTPYLNRRFFLQIARSMPETLLMVVARRDGRPIATALALFDHERLYGRYWGAIEFVPCLHFETSYSPGSLALKEAAARQAGPAGARHGGRGRHARGVPRRRDRRPLAAPRQGRRARSRAATRVAVQAFVPLGEMFGYATDLRSSTQGRATYTMQFERYEEVPANIAEEIVEHRTGEPVGRRAHEFCNIFRRFARRPRQTYTRERRSRGARWRRRSSSAISRT